jgi:hypothetical protein
MTTLTCLCGHPHLTTHLTPTTRCDHCGTLLWPLANRPGAVERAVAAVR